MQLKTLKSPTILLVLGLAAANLALALVFLSKPDGKLHLKVLDIGQGDSILIRTPAGFKVLVDGGPDSTVIKRLSNSLAPWDRKIDFVILTHPQADHLTGLIEVIKRYQVGSVLISGVTNSTATFAEWEINLKKKHLEPKIVKAGDKLIFPDQTQINFIWPEVDHPVAADLNATGVVFKLNYGSFSALLTGDADQQVQPYTGSIEPIDVLKVPHHGSKTALLADFAQKLHPKVAIISVGAKNRYGHPRPETLTLLENIGSKILRTDQNGTVEVVADGKSWYTKAEKGD